MLCSLLSQLLNALCRDFLSGEGNLVKHLSNLGVTVGYQQKFIDEYDFSVSTPSSALTASEALLISQSLGVAPAAAATPTCNATAFRAHVNLLDTGAAAGIHGLADRTWCVPNSMRKNTTATSTANGVVVPPLKCTARIPLRTIDGRRKYLQLEDAVLLPDSNHNLISIGLLARYQHVGMWVAPTDGSSYLELADGDRVPIINDGVSVLPDATAPVCVAQGDDVTLIRGGTMGRTNVTYE